VAVSRALRRLLRIRELEEEQNRLALDAAVSEMNRLEHARSTAIERQHRGRQLVDASVQNGQVMDRIAGFEETRSALCHAEALLPRIESQSEEVVARREEYLAKRVERRQAETLIEETEAREAIEAGRRGQQSLDDWYSSRLYRVAVTADAAPSDGATPAAGDSATF
jgi:flagellar export protein FliJ